MHTRIKLAIGALLLSCGSAAVVISAGAAAERTIPAPVPVTQEEHARTIEAMKPPKRKRPVVAVLGNQPGSETTDFLIPYGVLTQSGVADVLAVAPTDDPIQLRPSIRIRPQATLAGFDQRFPDGADYVIVPAMAPSPEIIRWIQVQAAKGAKIMGICSGARILSQAGLLKDKSATGYWLDLGDLQRENPTMKWVPNRRVVADRGVITTTGITASLPASLALVEAIAGRVKADALAEELGAAGWDLQHDSSAFDESARSQLKATRAKIRASGPKVVGVPVTAGVDEISLGFIADAYSRANGRAAVTVASSAAPIRTKRGLMLLPDRQTGSAGAPRSMIRDVAAAEPAQALEASLQKIAEQSGEDIAQLVALQMEYPRKSFTR